MIVLLWPEHSRAFCPENTFFVSVGHNIESNRVSTPLLRWPVQSRWFCPETYFSQALIITLDVIVLMKLYCSGLKSRERSVWRTHFSQALLIALEVIVPVQPYLSDLSSQDDVVQRTYLSSTSIFHWLSSRDGSVQRIYFSQALVIVLEVIVWMQAFIVAF